MFKICLHQPEPLIGSAQTGRTGLCHEALDFRMGSFGRGATQEGDGPSIEQLEKKGRGDLHGQPDLWQQGDRGFPRIDDRPGASIPQQESVGGKHGGWIREGNATSLRHTDGEQMAVGLRLRLVEIEVDTPCLQKMGSMQIGVEHLLAKHRVDIIGANT